MPGLCLADPYSAVVKEQPLLASLLDVLRLQRLLGENEPQLHDLIGTVPSDSLALLGVQDNVCSGLQVIADLLGHGLSELLPVSGVHLAQLDLLALPLLDEGLGLGQVRLNELRPVSLSWPVIVLCPRISSPRVSCSRGSSGGPPSGISWSGAPVSPPMASSGEYA